MINEFIHQDVGAVTIDWVVLTAAIVALGLAVLSVVSGGVENLSEDTAVALADDTIVETSNFAAAALAMFDGAGYTTAGYISQSVWDTNIESGEWFDSFTDADILDLVSDTSVVMAAGSPDATDMDVYAASYAEAQRRGLDVSGFESPDTYRANF